MSIAPAFYFAASHGIVIPDRWPSATCFIGTFILCCSYHNTPQEVFTKIACCKGTVVSQLLVFNGKRLKIEKVFTKIAFIAEISFF